MKKARKSAKASQAKERIVKFVKKKKNRKILREGRFLSLDPSSGSTSSMPGYAIFENGKLLEAGILELSVGKELNFRLQELGHLLRTEFQNVELVIVEDVPAIPIYTQKQAMAKGKTFMTTKQVASLQKSAGLCIGSFHPDIPTIRVSPLTWSAYKRNYDWQVEKNDTNDAVIMGMTVLQILNELEEKEE